MSARGKRTPRSVLRRPRRPACYTTRNMNLPQPAHGRVDPSLLDWLRESIRIGSDLTQSVLALRSQGYSDDAILDAIEELSPGGDAFEQGVMTPPLLQR